MSVAATTEPPPEWFLARDGEQFGPLSDAELRKLVEFGHLKPTDLLWREGFPEWRPARILLAEHSGATKVAPSPPAAAVPAGPAAAPSGPTPIPAQAATPASHAPAAMQGQIAAPNAAVAQAQRAPQAQAVVRRPAPAPMTGPITGPHAPHVGPLGPGPGAFIPQPRQQATARPVDMPRPAPAAPVAPAIRKASAAPVHREDVEDDYDDVEESSRAVVWIKRAAVLIFFVCTLAAAGWLAYPFRDQITSSISRITGSGGLSGLGGNSPVAGFQPTPEATDVALQKTALWRVLKRDFPDWYGERVKEAAAQAKAEKGDQVIGQLMMQQIVALRRKHAGDALSATMPKLKTLATAFADNLVRLRQVGPDACHAFISTGETSSDYLKLLADNSHSRVLQAQLVAVFEAIADGRKLPRIYPQPKQTDYNVLVTALTGRGWSDADMQLFSDSRRFGQATPEKVCQMVTDWFQAQIGLDDADIQLRLLADALKPVVAG